MSFEAVKSYYNKITTDYDTSRFENTYGDFINRQERVYRKKNLPKKGIFLNLGCGTGRFMEYPTIGVDFSDEMLALAKTKFPNKKYTTATAHLTTIDFNSVDSSSAFMLYHYLVQISPKDNLGLVL